MNARKSIHVFCFFVVMTLATLPVGALAGKTVCGNSICERNEAKTCPDDCSGGGGDGGLGSAIPLDCYLGASWAPTDPEYTVTDDKLGAYQDAVDKVNCEIGGPSIPWPVRLGVGGGNGPWANVRQVDIALGAFTLGGFSDEIEYPTLPDWVDPTLGSKLMNLYPGIFEPAPPLNPTAPEADQVPDMDKMDTLLLQVRPYRKDPDQTTESIHRLTPGKVYGMGMNFAVAGMGIDRFSISVAAQHYVGNENFTGIACETDEDDAINYANGQLILANAPPAEAGGEWGMQDVSVYLWLDGDDADDLPDGYSVTTGTFELDGGAVLLDPDTGYPVIEPGPKSKYAAVCSAVGPLVCGNPKTPSNCNFLGYVPVQFTMHALVK